MYSMGNQDYADSQRQAALALEFLCRTFPIVDDHVKEAVTEQFYTNFMVWWHMNIVLQKTIGSKHSFQCSIAHIS